jgi:putative transposase
MANWADRQVGLHFIPPGEPWHNGYVESFNSRIRDECLNTTASGHLPSASGHRRLEIGLQPPPTASALGYVAPAIYAGVCTHQ